MQNKPPVVYGDGKQIRSYTYVSDTAAATIKAALSQKADGCTLNIGNGDMPISNRDLAKLVIKIGGKEGKLDPEYKGNFKNCDRTQDREIYERFCDSSYVKKILDWDTEISLEEGIKKVFEIEMDGDEKKLNESGILSLLHSPKRKVRKLGSEAMTAGLKKDLYLNSFIYNNLLNDSKIFDELRNYKYPEHSRYMEEETDKEVVDLLISLVSKKYELVSRYYLLKKKILKLSQLYDYDRYAPIESSDKEVELGEAKKIVLESFGEFSETMKENAEKFFDNNWLDTKPGTGKANGAFCSYVTPDTHPYILLNYTGKTRDVMTLAHEIGHGIHALLARDRGFLSFDSSLALAETASVFGEMLVFNKEIQTISTKKEKLALICGKIEDIIATVFRQTCMYKFEQEVHQKRRSSGELTENEFNDIWHEKNAEMFGDSVKLTENYKVWWSYITHFMHSPFYVYTYAFGELLTLSLYGKYKKEGKSFEKKYLKLLSAGGSKSPKKLLKEIGIDITKKEFWNSGIDMIEELIKEAEDLFNEKK